MQHIKQVVDAQNFQLSTLVPTYHWPLLSQWPYLGYGFLLSASPVHIWYIISLFSISWPYLQSHTVVSWIYKLITWYCIGTVGFHPSQIKHSKDICFEYWIFWVFLVKKRTSLKLYVNMITECYILVLIFTVLKLGNNLRIFSLVCYGF